MQEPFQTWRRQVLALVAEHGYIPKEHTRLTRKRSNDKKERLPQREYTARIVGRYELRRGWANKMTPKSFIEAHFDKS